tara:strand:- start:22575 stop:23132 length:558 start_codon:yes stop_codon:yes gene_type:complete
VLEPAPLGLEPVPAPALEPAGPLQDFFVASEQGFEVAGWAAEVDLAVAEEQASVGPAVGLTVAVAVVEAAVAAAEAVVVVVWAEARVRRGLDGSWLTEGGEDLAVVVMLLAVPGLRSGYDCFAENVLAAWQWLAPELGVAEPCAAVVEPDVLLEPEPWPPPVGARPVAGLTFAGLTFAVVGEEAG